MGWIKATFVVIILLAIAAVTGFFVWLAPVGAGYTAKVMCSAIFVSGLSSNRALNEDVLADNNPLLPLIKANVDLRHQRVSAHAFGFRTRVAVYRPNLGCTLIDKHKANALQMGAPVVRQIKPQPLLSAATPPAVNRHKLEAILNEAMDEPGVKPTRRSRAIVILYNGEVVGERYAEGIDADTPLPGWSMTKSAFSAVLGRLRMVGRLPAIDTPVSINAWHSDPNDPRRNITYDQLMQMNSGLAFDESYGNPLSDVVQMLFIAPGAAGFAVSKPLDNAPGTHWSYSSGSTNILSASIRNLSPTLREYQSLPAKLLFRPLGMRHAVMETDSDGYFVASSFMEATGREWAKLGQLYLQDGVWKGKRLLPEGWVAHATTPAPTAPNGIYGALWWLKLPGDASGQPSQTNIPAPPADAFYALGHDGQSISVIPSRNLVIVRLGVTRDKSAFNLRNFVGGIAALFPSDGNAATGTNVKKATGKTTGNSTPDKTTKPDQTAEK